MQTLHDMLKHKPDKEVRRPKLQDELRGHYSKIGISAVAAATQFNGAGDTTALDSHQPSADRSTARGWSRHR